jgi:excisionase family DNA binding protein
METQAILRVGPNPDDWTDTAGAAEIIGRSRPTVYELVEKGTLTRYQLGTHGMFWVPECREVGAAIERLSGGRRG